MVPSTLAELVDRSAERHPAQVAFRCVSETASYEELALWTNRLANFLHAEGVNPGDRVGVFLPRCLQSAVAVYGVLKAGAVFVPIDPLTPRVRLGQILHDCQVRHLVTDASAKQSLEELAQQETPLESVLGVSLQETGIRSQPWSALDQLDHSTPIVAIDSEDLAYVMYTSGSTGRPKGIMHTHRSGLSYAELSANTYDVRPSDVIGNHSPLHFDMSTFGYFTAPLAGATTSIIPVAYTKMPASLSQLIQDHAMTIWYSVPFALIQLLLRGAIDQRDLSSLRWVLFGGEPFPMKHLRELMTVWPQARFSNVYGPAEVNQCTYFHLSADDVARDTAPSPDPSSIDQVPIGKVWDRTESLVLTGDQAGDYTTGELLIHSPTMMKGYWGRPDLDESAFYHHLDGKVFYRTGDLVRVSQDGNLWFLGRKDRQIKLRGHRIELDDVEAAFASHPAVEEVGAYPIVKNDEVVEIGVTLLLLETSQSASIVAKIAELAAAQIPVYAMPSQVVLADQLPRTTSGKIDRRALQVHAEQTSSSSVHEN